MKAVLNELACALGRRDEKPNVELAHKIAKAKSNKAVDELVGTINGKDKNVASDAIKVLYEIGSINPELISNHAQVFIDLLSSKDNRMQWGAMTAVSAIATTNKRELIFKNLSKIIDIADKGTVITKDRCVLTLAGLCENEKYINTCMPLLIEQILKAPPNQFVSYAEKTLPFVNKKFKQKFIDTLESRREDINNEAKQKRFEKILNKVNIL